MNIINTLMWAIVFHELGHLIAFRILGRKIEIRFYFDSWRDFGIKAGEKWDYVGLNTKELFSIYFCGIFLGFFPLVFYTGTTIIFIMLIFVYLSGCINDIRGLVRC